MVVDGAVVMVENIIRHIGQDHERRPVAERICAAAHEVQRPVFYAITIIITAYLPIITLHRKADSVLFPLRRARLISKRFGLYYVVSMSALIKLFQLQQGA